ncbi:MAG: hypothetical protein M3Q17_03500 [Actinomycetota bacterium]|nr:hypothetical protein [Actinomycetota bacterium]
MRVSRPGVGEIAAFVHTHGARLTRLAYLLGVDHPEVAAAASMASTLQRRNCGQDAHEDLLIAARTVGSRGVPAVHDDARLQGWLDRAELDLHDVDLGALVESTQHQLQTQRGARRRGRWRATAAAAVVALLIVAAGMVWPDDGPRKTLHAERSGILFPNDPYLNGGDPNAVLTPEVRGAGSLLSPPRQRVARGVVLAGFELSGRTTAIMPTALPDGPATLLAVPCTGTPLLSGFGLRAVCVLVAPLGVRLSDLGPEAVVAFLPPPRDGRVLAQGPLTVLRGSLIGTLASQTLLVDITSSEADTALVRYTDGSQIMADRYLLRGWPTPLFVARNKDVMPVSVVYRGGDGHTLGRRSLYPTIP